MSGITVAGVEAIRAHFPALQRVHNGVPVAYFDGPGGTQVPRAVAEAMTDYLYHHNANTHWAYPTSQETDALLDGARRAMADFLHARPTEVAFGANMSTLAFHLARAIGRGLGAGDEIVVTELDHQANVAPWQALARERGVTLRLVRFDPDSGRLALDDVQAAIGPRTRVVAIGMASNALGTITDVAAACTMARAAGAVSFVDAVHAAPHHLVDVQALGCDWLACSAYKFYGPHIGILWGRQERIEALDVPRLMPAPDWAPERLETGTQNHEGMVGAGTVVDFLAGLATGAGSRRDALEAVFAELHRRGEELFARLWRGLGEIPGVRLYGPPPGTPRTPTIAFTVAGMPSEQVAIRLAGQGVFVSHGDFYASTVVERYGLAEEGLVRAGCACYTTMAEVEGLVAGVRGMVEGRG